MKLLAYLLSTVLATYASPTLQCQSCNSSSEKYELVPLYRLHHNLCTISEKELNEFVIKHGWAQKSTLALVATNSVDCWGNRNLIPVYRFYNEATQNYFHSTEFNPLNENIEQYDYAGIGFYSSPSLNSCGASVALHSYWVQTHYAYTTDNATDEKLIIDAGGEYKGIVSYIWPNENPESKNHEIRLELNLQLSSSQSENNNIYTTSTSTSTDEATTTRTTDHTTSADASHCKAKAVINKYYYKINATEATYTNHTTSADDGTEATEATTIYNTSDDEAREVITTTEYALENTQGVEPQTVKDCPVNSVPLLRLYRGQTDNHFYTTSVQESRNAVATIQYTQEGSPGKVALTKSDCLCEETLTPIRRLYKPGSKEDHFYAANEFEANNAASTLGYIPEGIGFYCSSSQFHCGATVPLYRYFRGTDHFYTTDLNEGHQNVLAMGWKYEGILCYIWPSTTPVTVPQVVKDCLVNSVPLLRLYRGQTDNHFYTTSAQESQNAVATIQYTQEGSPGKVALTKSDCLCEETLTPIRRLYKPGSKEDHFYTASEFEANNAASTLGYIPEGIGFYCSSSQFHCGATVPLYRYFRGTDHFYTTDLNEGNQNVLAMGGKYEGILCYIWA